MTERTAQIVTQDIAFIVDHCVDPLRPINPSLLTQAVMETHSDVSGKDASFATCCAREYVREEVRRWFNRFKLIPKTRVSAQRISRAFAKLQRFYAIERNGEPRIVPIELLSDGELLAKARELRVMGQGCMEHAQEIERYVAMRESGVAA